MNFRPAETKDIDWIIKLSQRCNVSRESTEPTGFVEFPVPNFEEYCARIKDNPFFYILELRNKKVGFFASYSKKHLENFPQTKLLKEIRVISTNNFLYSEQLAILPEHRNKGLAKEAFNKLFKDARLFGVHLIRAAIVSAPHVNVISERMLKSLGFELTETIPEDGISFSIYSKFLN